MSDTSVASEAGAALAPEGPSPGAEIKPGVFAPLTPTAGSKPAAPRPMFEKAREEAPPASAEAPPAGEPAPDGEQVPPAADAPPTGEQESEEGQQTEETEGGAASELVVELPSARPEEDPFAIEVSDPVAAERLRQLVKGYARRQDAERIREEAAQLREEAEAINYAVELDPAGVVTETLQSPADQAHLARFLLTRPGVLERVQDFVAQLLEQPDSANQLAALAEAERIRRKEHVGQEVRMKQELDRNARQLVKTLDRSLESLIPDSHSDEARMQLREDVLGDLQRYARANNLRLVDPRVVPGMVQRRLAVYGVAPKTKGQPPAKEAAPGVTAPAASASAPPAAAKPQKTGAQFTAARAARRAAASAPPGVGAPVSTGPQKPPPYDPSQPGTPVQQAANWAKRNLALRRQGPQ